MSEDTERSFVEKREGDTWINAVLGAVLAYVVSVTVVGGVVASFVGGAAAGYLQQGTRTESAKVGALSGVISALPLIPGVLPFLGVLGIGLLEVGARGLFGFGLAGEFTFLFLLFGVAFLYIVGLSAAGGYVGAILFERQRSTGEVAEDRQYESEWTATVDEDVALEETREPGSDPGEIGDANADLEETGDLDERSDSTSRR